MPSRQRILLIILALAVLFLTVSGLRYLRQRSVRAMGAGLRTEEAVAFQFGRLIKERLPGNGPVLVVQLPPATDGIAARANRQLAAFRRGLEAPAKSVIVVSPAQMSNAALMDLGGRMYSGQWSRELLAWIAPHPNPRAVVSFMGFPEDLPAELPVPWPPLLAVYAGRARPAAEWVEQKKAFALAELRPDAPLGAEPDPKATAEQIFARCYKLELAP
jgi:hypothetical protein